MSRHDPARLAALARLAAMQREAELARLAAAAQSRARLIEALAALGAAEAPLEGDPALMRARLAHAGWIEGRRRILNERLAMVTADWLARRPPAVRAFGRAAVLDRLAMRAGARVRQARQARRDDAPQT